LGQLDVLVGEKGRERGEERERWIGPAGEREKERDGGGLEVFFEKNWLLRNIPSLKRISSSIIRKIGEQLRKLCNKLIFSFPGSFIL